MPLVLLSGQCRSKARLDGKTIIVTGCNTGIGKETVLDFYKRGGRIIMACRSVDKAQQALWDIEEKCKELPHTGTLVVAKCDVGSLASIREFTQHILATEPQINILINNAGIWMAPLGYTEDGFESQFGTNHIGHFYLTLLLLPRIISSKPARIVTVSSHLHVVDDVHLDDLNNKNRPYKPLAAYSQSKIANILFSRELSNRLKEHNIHGVNTYSLHPGVVNTEITRYVRGCGRGLLDMIVMPLMKTPKQGAQTTIYCAVDEECADQTGLYYRDCVVQRPNTIARDDEKAKKLWDISLEMVGLTNYNPFTATDSGVALKKN